MAHTNCRDAGANQNLITFQSFWHKSLNLITLNICHLSPKLASGEAVTGRVEGESDERPLEERKVSRQKGEG